MTAKEFTLSAQYSFLPFFLLWAGFGLENAGIDVSPLVPTTYGTNRPTADVSPYVATTYENYAFFWKFRRIPLDMGERMCQHVSAHPGRVCFNSQPVSQSTPKVSKIIKK